MVMLWLCFNLYIVALFMPYSRSKQYVDIFRFFNVSQKGLYVIIASPNKILNDIHLPAYPTKKQDTNACILQMMVYNNKVNI